MIPTKIKHLEINRSSSPVFLWVMKKVLTGTQKPGKMISLSANTKRNSMTYRKRMVTESFIEISGRGECHQYSLEEWEIVKMILAIIPIENNSLNKLKIVRGIKELFTLSLTQAIILVESASEDL